jgi:DNA adenine methylase
MQKIMKPFLKWAGGKYRLVERIRAHLPPGRRLIEPFVGSAAVFLNTDYPTALLADVNVDLIGCYKVLQREGPGFVAYARSFFTPENNTSNRYYLLRDRFNTTSDPIEKAALFLYLNRHGYNGLCRYNNAGAFNVPFGRYRQPYFPETELLGFWEKAQQAIFRRADFREVLADAEPGDVVYCDPPYVPLTATANFTDYAAGGFGPKDQADLAQWAERLAAQGVWVVISNHDTADTAALYAKASALERFGVRRFISCEGANRQVADEVLAVYGGW